MATILVVSAFLPHPHAVNAAGVVMHGQYRALTHRHDVRLLTLAGPDPADRDAAATLRRDGAELRCVWREPPRSLSRQRLRMAAAWLAGDEPLRNLRFHDPRMQRAIDDELARWRPDVVQVEDIAMAAYRYSGPHEKILTEHEVRSDATTDPPDGPPLLRTLRVNDGARWRRVQPRLWSAFDRIQVYTPRDAADAARLAPGIAERLRVNPFGIDLPAPADPAREETDTVAFVGGFLHPPNVDAALWLVREILPLLRSERPAVRLALVGSHPPPEVCALASASVQVTGRVDAVEPFIERAAVVVAPLRAGGGLRFKVLHAMAMGKAVVSTPLGAEGIRGADALAVAADTPAFAARAAALLADAGERRRLGARARAIVAEQHTWAAYAERWEVMYDELRAELPVAAVRGMS